MTLNYIYCKNTTSSIAAAAAMKWNEMCGFMALYNC